MLAWLSAAALVLALSAGPLAPELSRAQGMIERGDFEEAVRALQNCLGHVDELSEDELVETYHLLGLAYLSLGNESEATHAYRRLLQTRPDFKLPRDAPPKLQRLHARVAEELRRPKARPIIVPVDPLPAAKPEAKPDPKVTRADALPAPSPKAPAAEAPWYQNPYVWAGGGTVAVAAAAGVVIAVTHRERGSVTIVIRTGAVSW
jgi:tetratricopeptide (TPR) repeat protein